MQQNAGRNLLLRRSVPSRLGGLPQAGLAAALFLAAFATWLELDRPDQGTGLLAFVPALLLAASLCAWQAAACVAMLATGAVMWLGAPVPPGLADTANLPAFALFALAAALAIGLAAWLRRLAESLDRERSAAVAAQAELALMVREQQHRIANDLQLASAVLSLEARRSADDGARAALAGAVRRLELLAGLHRRVCAAAAGAAGEAGLLEAVAHDLVAALGPPGLACVLELEALPLDGRTVALILMELLVNALKHAFPDGRPGRIEVCLRAAGPGRATLEVRDDGIATFLGQPGNGSLGMAILHALAAQIGGELRFLADSGTVAILDFPLTPPPDA